MKTLILIFIIYMMVSMMMIYFKMNFFVLNNNILMIIILFCIMFNMYMIYDIDLIYVLMDEMYLKENYNFNNYMMNPYEPSTSNTSFDNNEGSSDSLFVNYPSSESNSSTINDFNKEQSEIINYHFNAMRRNLYACFKSENLYYQYFEELDKALKNNNNISISINYQKTIYYLKDFYRHWDFAFDHWKKYHESSD